MAAVLVLIARRIPPPAQPVAETITVVFTPAPVAELLDVPSVPDVAEPPRIQPPPEPQPPTAAPLPSPPITIPEPEPPSVDLETPPPSIPPPPAPASPEPIPEPESSPVDLAIPPPSSIPPPPTAAPTKPITHPPTPRPAPRPRPSNAPSSAPAPVQAQTPQGTPPVTPANSPPPAAINPGWQNALGAWLQANKTYPDEARRRGDEGRATVRFTVNREGRVVDFQLLSMTGSAILDAAVERLLRGARLPPFPAGMDQEQVTVTLQIRYALEH